MKGAQAAAGACWARGGCTSAWLTQRHEAASRPGSRRGLCCSFAGGTSGKESACQCRRCERRGLDPWLRKIPWGRPWQPTPVFLSGEAHGQRSLAG